MQSKTPLPALTGLRFVAALQVLLYHTLPHDLGPSWFRAIVGSGYVGVGLFFVLSGFILAYNYEEAIRSGGVSWPSFWWARFARVYPVYLLGLLVAIPPFFLGGRAAGDVLGRIGASVGSGALMAQAWSPRTACVVNCPGWSVSVEALFYLVFPIAALGTARLGRGRLWGLAAAAWAVTLAAPLLYLALDPDGAAVTGPLSGGAWLFRLKYHPLSHLGEFVLGVATGALFLRGGARANLGWFEPAAVGAILVVLAASPGIPYPLLHNGLLAPLFALLVYRLGRGDGPLARILSGRGWATLGGASYALYILHVPAGSWLDLLFRSAGASPAPLVRFAAQAAVSMAAALLVFHHVEEPARRALRDLWKRPGRRRAPLPAPEPLLAGD